MSRMLLTNDGGASVGASGRPARSPTSTTVLVLIPSFYRAGAEVMACETAVRVQARGRFRPVVAAVHANRGPQEVEMRDALRSVGVASFVLGGDMNPHGALRALVPLLRLCRRERPSIIHSHCEVPDLLGRIAATLTGAAHVSTAHNVTLWPWRPHLGHWLERRMLWATSQHAAVSAAVAAMLENDLGIARSCITVIRNGIDLRRLDVPPADLGAVGVRPGQRVFLAVGRLERQKGPDVLLAALAELSEEFPNLCVLWAGDGPLRDELQGEAERRGVANQIRFLGVRSDVPALLAAADLFVLPSRWEGLPVALLEAMGAGQAIVATAVGGVPEIVEDGVNGLLVPPGDPGALAAAMRRLLRDPAQAARLRANALQVSRGRNDPEGIAGAYEHLYDRTHARRGRPQAWLDRGRLWFALRSKTLHVPVLPMVLDVEPINTCNFRCDHCQVTHWNKPAARLGVDRFQELLHQLPHLSRIKLQGMGEPMLNRELLPMLRVAADHDVDASFITNGSVLTPALARELVALRQTRVVFSLDGASPETFTAMRKGGDLHRVCDNIRHLVEARGPGRTPSIGVWTVVGRTNLGEISDIVRLASHLGVDDITLQPFISDWGRADMRDRAGALRVGRGDPELATALAEAGAVARELGLPLTQHGSNRLSRRNQCSWPWTSAFIAANGDVVPCCVVADADTVRMGNVFAEPFETIWNSAGYRELRRRIRDHDLPDYCRNCYADP